MKLIRRIYPGIYADLGITIPRFGNPEFTKPGISVKSLPYSVY